VRSVAPFGIVAHRGLVAGATENTLEAFRSARTAGVDAVEFDVRLTHDRVAVVHHNYYVNAAAGSPIFAIDSTAIAAPTLRDVLEEFAGRFGLEIEVKGPEPEAADVVAGLLSPLAAHWETIEVTSSETVILQHLGAICPSLPTALLFPASEPWMRHDVVAYAALHRARGAGAAAVHLHASQLTPEVVATIRAGGVDVHAHSVNDDDALRTASSLAVPWICTDAPERALAFRRALG